MSEGEESWKARKTGSSGKRVKKQEPGVKKAEVSSPMLRQAQQHDKKDPEIKELPTENSSRWLSGLQTEEMEVHHHPQLEHKPKPWKEYLLEGLMIFVAVTMGFFAESLREHITNNEREKQYVESMINDLKDDKGKLKAHIKQCEESRDMMDSLIYILNDPGNIPRHGDELYYFGRLAPRFPTLPVNMRTYEELKNSGNFRLISKMAVSNAIMSYYEKIPYMRQIEDLYTEEFASYKKVAENVFEPVIFRRQEIDSIGGVKRSTDNPALQKNAEGFIKELSVDAIYMNASRKQNIVNDKDLLKSADELLDLLKKEYHLEDE